MITTRAQPTLASIQAAAKAAGTMIPPAWPLASTVAVNPFLGQAGLGLPETAALLERVAGVRVCMPRSWFEAKIDRGAITDADLAAALAAAPAKDRLESVTALKAMAKAAHRVPLALPTVAHLAARHSGLDWPGIITDRIGVWAGAEFDAGQALWAAARPPGTGPATGVVTSSSAYPSGSAYPSWRRFATHDLTPEIAGLQGFAARVQALPERAEEALEIVVRRLGLSDAALPTCFHAMLMSMGGWAQAARWRLWQAEMSGGTDDTLFDLLAIRLVYEDALLARYAALRPLWDDACQAHAVPVSPAEDHVVDAILQEAAERAEQRGLAALLAAPTTMAAPRNRSSLQAAFCIDVRSEVFRRALESVDAGIETIGFAGFFGLPLSHRRFGSSVSEAHLPVLLSPGIGTCVAVTPELEAKEAQVQVLARAKRAWKRFRIAAVSSFAFVEAAGPVYAGKLLQDSLRIARPSPAPDPAPRLDPAIGHEQRVATALAVLRAMSMTSDFARIVLLSGHGAHVVNNPHASALHCGACGGQTGEVSARVLAGLLNDPAVREGLADAGLALPPDTFFVAGLHDTTTDTVTLFDQDVASPAHTNDMAQLRDWLAQAARLARTERALRLPRAKDESDIAVRSRDWAEIRAEWGLAGCKAFIAAPRRRTAGRDLAGRAFLHSYEWAEDKDFGILELILTAPVVVASWISLQYYGSTVAPDVFGAGNKLLHNVVGGMGVLEGNGGPLRVGLPWQSVHDGEKLIHDPVRLTVAIEAPCAAMTDILARHPGVRTLFDQHWMHLLALDDNGQIAWRYAGHLTWEPAVPA